MKALRHLLAVIALASALPLQAQELVVSAAASLTQAFEQIGSAYEKSHPGQKIVLNFAASGPLLAQIRQGAPVDVFASADQATMDRAQNAKLLAPGTRADFARNTLVLVLPAASTQQPADLKALAGPAFTRIASGTPATVPAGKYTAEALAQAGLAHALAPKAVYAESVRQVLDYVARGEVDAGFVYRTDALVQPGRTRIAFTVPTATPVSYPIAQVDASRNAERARAFIAFVRGGEGQAILQRFGFSPP